MILQKTLFHNLNRYTNKSTITWFQVKKSMNLEWIYCCRHGFLLLEKKMWQLWEGIERKTGISNIDYLNFKVTVIDKRIRKSGYTRLISWFLTKSNFLIIFCSSVWYLASYNQYWEINIWIPSILIFHNLIFLYKCIKIQSNYFEFL